MSFPRRRQRTTTPLQDAKEAILNTKNMNEDERFQLLSDNLPELTNEDDCLTLVEMCVEVCWTDGLSMILARVPVEALDSKQLLFSAICNKNLTKEAKLRIVSNLVVKGCQVNISHKISRDDVYVFISVEEKIIHRSPYGSSGSTSSDITPFALFTSHDDSEITVAFAQELVRLNLPSILKFVLPQISESQKRAALTEALGQRNRDECCELLISDIVAKGKEKINNQNKSRASYPYLGKPTYNLELRVVFLCCVFGRDKILERYLLGATRRAVRSGNVVKLTTVPEFLNDFETVKFKCSQFSQQFSYGETECTPLEAAVRFERPACIQVMIRAIIDLRGAHDEAKLKSNIVDLIKYCREKDLSDECTKVLVQQLMNPNDPPLDTLTHVLSSFLRSGRNSELTYFCIFLLWNKIKALNTDASKSFIDSIISYCASRSWWNGLLLLVSVNNNYVLERTESVIKDAERTLVVLVSQNRDFPIVTDIVKHLAIFSPDMNLEASFLAAVRNEHVEFVKFFLSLNNSTVLAAVKQSRNETKNPEIKKLLEEDRKVKIEPE